MAILARAAGGGERTDVTGTAAAQAYAWTRKRAVNVGAAGLVEVPVGADLSARIRNDGVAPHEGGAGIVAVGLGLVSVEVQRAAAGIGAECGVHLRRELRRFDRRAHLDLSGLPSGNRPGARQR